MSSKHAVIFLAIGWLELGAASSPALGDGGTLRFSGRRGDRVVTVFTTPTPLSAGPIDLSVLVQDRQTGRPITDLSIEVHAQPLGKAKQPIRALATSELATNKLFRAARLELTEPGRWHFDVFVLGVDQAQPIGFNVEVAQPSSSWLEMSLWVAWPLVPIGLFAIAQFRLRRRPSGHGWP
jgi:hypothetical protein